VNYRDLEAWQLAMNLAQQVYELTNAMPPEEKFALTRQIREAASSISANIAEGSGRGGTAELIYFLGVANGSRCEMESRLILAYRINHIRDPETILELSARIGIMLLRLIDSLKKKLKPK